MYKPAKVALSVLSGRKTWLNITKEELLHIGIDVDSFPHLGGVDLKETAEGILYNWIDNMYDEIDRLKEGK